MFKSVLKFLFPFYFYSEKIYVRYKISHFFYSQGFVILGHVFEDLIRRKYNCFINGKAVISGMINFPHPAGIVIGEGCIIGENVTIYQNVTLGRKDMNIPEYPVIKNNCVIYSNSVILGKITIGDNTIIGCNSVVTKSISGGVYAGIPLKKIT